MKRDDLLDALSTLDAIEQHFEDCVEVWRVIVDKDGHEVRRIYRCSFYRARGEEPREKGTST